MAIRKRSLLRKFWCDYFGWATALDWGWEVVLAVARAKRWDLTRLTTWSKQLVSHLMSVILGSIDAISKLLIT